jgi:hypothetical protein
MTALTGMQGLRRMCLTLPKSRHGLARSTADMRAWAAAIVSEALEVIGFLGAVHHDLRELCLRALLDRRKESCACFSVSL